MGLQKCVGSSSTVRLRVPRQSENEDYIPDQSDVINCYTTDSINSTGLLIRKTSSKRKGRLRFTGKKNKKFGSHYYTEVSVECAHFLKQEIIILKLV